MTIIKICGLKSPEDVGYANALRPDMVGFVFAENSRRRVFPEYAATLRRGLDPGIKAVGVFVNDDPDTIVQLARNGVIDMIQLHGDESDEDVVNIRRLTGCKVIKAFRVSSDEDIKKAGTSSADLVLLDSGYGSGETFDWDLIDKMRRRYILAGGLDPLNVGDALQRLHPYGVDVSSGVETDGRKDPAKMEAFVRAVREQDD